MDLDTSARMIMAINKLDHKLRKLKINLQAATIADVDVIKAQDALNDAIQYRKGYYDAYMNAV